LAVKIKLRQTLCGRKMQRGVIQNEKGLGEGKLEKKDKKIGCHAKAKNDKVLDNCPQKKNQGQTIVCSLTTGREAYKRGKV